jgi:hypothetical protein
VLVEMAETVTTTTQVVFHLAAAEVTAGQDRMLLLHIKVAQVVQDIRLQLVAHQLDTQVAVVGRQTGERAELVELELTEVEPQMQVVTV